MKTKFISQVAFCFAAVTSVVTASTIIPAAPQTRPIVLSGGTVHPVNGATLPKGDVMFVGGKIAAVGEALKAPADAEVIDVRGKHVYPGLINALTTLGLVEVEAVRATVDAAEVGAINPNARAQIAINPDSELLPVARSNGVLTALTVPSARPDLIAGTSAVIRLDGWTWEEMTVRAPAALHVTWPRMTLNRDPLASKNLADQQKDIDAKGRKLDDAFAAARAYAVAKAAAASAGRPAPDVDLRWEAMAPVFDGSLPVCVQAYEAKQIEAALAWAKRQQIKLVLISGPDVVKFAARLKEMDVAVILGGTQTLPVRRDDAFDAPFTAPEALRAAGVRFCIAGSEGGPSGFGNERNVAYEAAKAVGYGLAPAEALKAVTLSAAQVLGVGDELGSLEVGKRATIIVTDGDPLEIPTQVEIAFVDGRRIELKNLQTELYEKYRRKYAK